ncbi:hypothetical protein JCM11641_005223 [Rhodosporidiobolus odoratus]
MWPHPASAHSAAPRGSLSPSSASTSASAQALPVISRERETSNGGGGGGKRSADAAFGATLAVGMVRSSAACTFCRKQKVCLPFEPLPLYITARADFPYSSFPLPAPPTGLRLLLASPALVIDMSLELCAAVGKSTTKVRSNAQALAVVEGRVTAIEHRLVRLEEGRGADPPSHGGAISVSPHTEPAASLSSNPPLLPQGSHTQSNGSPEQDTSALQARIWHLEAQVRALQGVVYQLLPPAGFPMPPPAPFASPGPAYSPYPPPSGITIPASTPFLPPSSGALGGPSRWLSSFPTGSAMNGGHGSEPSTPGIAPPLPPPLPQFSHLQLHFSPSQPSDPTFSTSTTATATTTSSCSTNQQAQAQGQYPTPDLPCSAQMSSYLSHPHHGVGPLASPPYPATSQLFQPHPQHPQSQVGVEALLGLQRAAVE